MPGAADLGSALQRPALFLVAFERAQHAGAALRTSAERSAPETPFHRASPPGRAPLWCSKRVIVSGVRQLAVAGCDGSCPIPAPGLWSAGGVGNGGTVVSGAVSAR